MALDITVSRVAQIIEQFTDEAQNGYPEDLKGKELDYCRLHINRYVDTLRLVPLLDEPEKVRLLDIGALMGHVSIAVSKLFGYQVYAIDLEGEETSSWKGRFIDNGIGFAVCDIAKEPLPFESESFDIVLFTEVLEHLTVHPKEVLDNINQVLKVSGALILSTPNLVNVISRVRFLLGVNPTHVGQSHPPVGHYREYSASELSYLLQSSGFEIQHLSQRYTPYHRWFLDLPYWLFRLVPSLRNTILIRARKTDMTDDSERKVEPLLTDFEPPLREMLHRCFRPKRR